MSAGAFTRTAYTADDGKNFPIRLQPETLDAEIDGTPNESIVDAGDSGLPSVRVSAGARSLGVIPRKLTIALNDGQTAPAGYTGEPLQLVVPDVSVFDQGTLGAAVTYLGVNWSVIGRRREAIR